MCLATQSTGHLPEGCARTAAGSYNGARPRWLARLHARHLRPHPTEPHIVQVEQEVIKTLQSVLSLAPGSVSLTADTALLGSLPELDSMAVVSILTALEERFGFAIDDDEVDGRTFESVGSLTRFVQSKLDR